MLILICLFLPDTHYLDQSYYDISIYLYIHTIKINAGALEGRHTKNISIFLVVEPLRS